MSNSQHGSDEEEDYMSEAFLNSLVSASESQKTKKQSMTYSERRRQKEREHLANLPKPLKEREREAREKGLETEIGEENKGMAMLLKMGFKKGGTLGASKQKEEPPSTTEQPTSHTLSSRSDVLRAPLAIQMKQGRGGLGMDKLQKQKEQEEVEQTLKRAHEVFDVDYRGSKRDQFDHDKRSRQLGAAQAICMQLDVKEAAKDAQEGKDAEEDASEPEREDRESRRMGRSNSFWWIADSTPDDLVGTRMMGRAAPATTTTKGRRNFDLSDDEDGDPEDRKEKRVRLSTPDPTYEETVEEDEEPEAQWGERPAYAELSVYEKLEKVVQYLRQEHSYCFWCSAQYYGQKDLEENCPGESEDDH
ncbi:G patch domain-containing protein 11 [Podila verticillata]|nr:G patch domain-containing protein 11 [Podila verticillata]